MQTKTAFAWAANEKCIYNTLPWIIIINYNWWSEILLKHRGLASRRLSPSGEESGTNWTDSTFKQGCPLIKNACWSLWCRRTGGSLESGALDVPPGCRGLKKRFDGRKILPCRILTVFLQLTPMKAGLEAEVHKRERERKILKKNPHADGERLLLECIGASRWGHPRVLTCSAFWLEHRESLFGLKLARAWERYIKTRWDTTCLSSVGLFYF